MRLVNLRGFKASLLVELNGSGSYELVPFPEDRKTITIGDYMAITADCPGRLGWRVALRWICREP